MITRYFTPNIVKNGNSDAYNIFVNILENIGEVPDKISNPLGINYADEIRGYDVMDFIDDTYDLLSNLQKYSDDWKHFSLQPASTYFTLDTTEQNAIRYSIIKRTYATTEQGAIQHTGRRDYKWMLRDIVNDRLNPGYKALIYIKPFDNTIEFTSWSRNYRDANLYAHKLEDVFDTYGYIFKRKGLLDLRYEGRQADVVENIKDFRIYGCPLIYYVRTMKVKVVYEKILESLVIEILTNKS